MKLRILCRSIFFALAAASVLCACGKSQDTPAGNTPADAPSSSSGGVAGSWKGDGSSATDPTTKSMEESMSLDLKPDKTFSATMGVPMEGSWTASRTTVTLTLTKLGGSSIADLHKQMAKDPSTTDDLDKPVLLEVSSDGKTLTVTQVQTGKPMTPMVFKRP